MRKSSILRRMASVALLVSAAWLHGQSFDLDADRQPVVSLDGLWRFHPGDSPASPSHGSAPKGEGAELWAQPGFDDSAWPLLRSDDSWSVQGYPAMSGYGWYRFTVQVPPGDTPTSMMFAPIVTSFEVYVDGRMVGGSGAMPPTLIPTTKFNYLIFPLTEAGSDSPRTVQVALRVWHSPIWSSYVGGGPYEPGHLAGDPDALASEQLHEQLGRNVRFVDYYSYSISAALIGLAVLCLFLFRPAEREYLWFAVILLAQAADSALTVSKEIYAFPPIPLFDLFDAILSAVAIFASFCFFSMVLKVPAGMLGRVSLALVVFSPFPAIFYWPQWLSVPASATTQLVCLLPAAFWIFWFLFRRAVQGNLDARLLLIPTLLDLGFYVADNVAIVVAQAGLTKLPRLLEVPLPLPPFTIKVGILLHLFFLLAMLVFLIRRFTLARQQEERMSGEFEAARQIQLVLLPDGTDQSPGFDVECIYCPAEQVGGDFFQQTVDRGGGMAIVVGDVSGKGLPAAILVSVLVGAIREGAACGVDPAALLSSLNERVMNRSRGGFTTCLAAHITAEGQLTLANAGHLPPYLNGNEMDLPGALPLGVVTPAEYECTTIQLAPGDRLTFISDGVAEAQSKSGELFGFDRARQLSTEPADRIAQAASAFGQVDDITVVTVQYLGSADLGVAI